MSKLIKQIVTFLISICIVFSMCSCSSESSNTNSVESIDPNGDIFSEEIMYEEILKEDILTEHKLQEYIIGVENVVEDKLDEDIILEDIQVEILLADDIDGMLDEYMYFSGEAGQYDIDWFEIIGKFAAGTTIIVVTGVAAYFTAEIPGVGYVFATSCKEALKQAVIGAAVGAALNSAIMALKTGGNVDAVTKYALEGAADGFMWGAITGALTGAFSGYVDYYKNTNKIFNGNKLLGTIDDNGNIKSNGKVVGFKTQSGHVVDTTGKVLGIADDAGNIGSVAKSLIPSSNNILSTSGRSVSYTINANKQVINSSGKIIGKINDAGQIIDDTGYLIGQLDDAGRLIPGVNKAVKAGLKLTPSGYVTNVNETGQILDDIGNAIGFIEKAENNAGDIVSYAKLYVDSSSISYIGDIPQSGLSKTVGQLDDAGNLVENWTKVFQAERSKGVKAAWYAEREMVLKTERGTRDWTADEIVELIETGKVKGYQGHHINSAMYSPSLAANPDNIYFYSATDHLIVGHGGNYQTATFGELLLRLF